MFYRTLKLYLALLMQICALTLLLSGAASSYAGLLPAKIEPEVGKTYYTRYNFKYEKGRHVTTNYWRGLLVPFNTKVTLKSMSEKKLVLDIDGEKVTIKNVKKHSLRDIKTIASELLSPTKISLRGIAEEIRNDMEAGVMRLDMTKEQVLVTRGYPPRHKTASTKANTWIFWSSRFVQRTIVFKGNKLVRGRGLY